MDRHRDAIHNGGVERSRALIWTIFVTLIGHLDRPCNWPYDGQTPDDHSKFGASLQAPSGGNSSSKIESGLPNRSFHAENVSK